MGVNPNSDPGRKGKPAGKPVREDPREAEFADIITGAEEKCQALVSICERLASVAVKSALSESPLPVDISEKHRSLLNLATKTASFIKDVFPEFLLREFGPFATIPVASETRLTRVQSLSDLDARNDLSEAEKLAIKERLTENDKVEIKAYSILYKSFPVLLRSILQNGKQDDEALKSIGPAGPFGSKVKAVIALGFRESPKCDQIKGLWHAYCHGGQKLASAPIDETGARSSLVRVFNAVDEEFKNNRAKRRTLEEYYSRGMFLQLVVAEVVFTLLKSEVSELAKAVVQSSHPAKK